MKINFPSQIHEVFKRFHVDQNRRRAARRVRRAPGARRAVACARPQGPRSKLAEAESGEGG
jgi:hypothetical protein